MFNSTTSQQRSAFNDDDLSTASPRRVLVKCFDRLDTDLARALQAIADSDPEAANRALGHAQDLLGEVAGMLDTDAWQPAGGLLAVYDYVLRLLAVGNIHKAPEPIIESQTLLREIGDAFRTAVTEVESGARTAAAQVAPPRAAAGSFNEPRPVSAAGGFSTFA